MKNRVHKLIEAQNPEKKAALNNKIKNKLNITDEPEKNKKDASGKKPSIHQRKSEE